MSESSQESTHRTIERVARESYGRLVAYLSSHTRDVAQRGGCPQQRLGRGAHCLAARRRAAKSRGLAADDRAPFAHRSYASPASCVSQRTNLLLLRESVTEMPMTTEFPDERLKLLFVCAHPAIDPAMHTPLMLQTVLGLDAASIAQAFLIPPTTMGQRLVRAKTKIRDGGIPFEVPQDRELAQRLDAVLEAIYAAFGISWDDMAGGDQRGRDLAEEAIWLARVLLQLMPEESEVRGLLALMLHCEARRAARRGEGGRYIPLSEQDTKLWSRPLIEEAERHLAEASSSRSRRTISARGRDSIGPRRAGAHRPDRMDCHRDVLRTTDPYLSDARHSNWARRGSWRSHRT